MPEGSEVSALATWLTGPRSASVPVVSATSRSLTTSEAGHALDVGRSAISLSQLLAGVASAVAAAYRAGVWTTVVVTEVRARGGHVYLELSEHDRNGLLIAKTTGTIWAGTAMRASFSWYDTDRTSRSAVSALSSCDRIGCAASKAGEACCASSQTALAMPCILSSLSMMTMAPLAGS
jgi:hypothetical protein